MAFLQNEFPPSTAPAPVRPQPARTRRPMPFSKPARRRRIDPVRLTAFAVLAAIALVVGDRAFAATESLALAILAADLAVLLSIATLSGFRRR